MVTMSRLQSRKNLHLIPNDETRGDFYTHKAALSCSLCVWALMSTFFTERTWWSFRVTALSSAQKRCLLSRLSMLTKPLRVKFGGSGVPRALAYVSLRNTKTSFRRKSLEHSSSCEKHSFTPYLCVFTQMDGRQLWHLFSCKYGKNHL